MKRSTKVALTLLVPAMTAFGCGGSASTVHAPNAHQVASDCSVPAKPGEPEKKPCPPASSTSHGSHYGSSRGGWFGGTHSSSGSVVHSTPHGSTGSSHVSSVRTGGFGRIGSFFSGGS